MNKNQLTKKVRADLVKSIEFSLDKLDAQEISERILKKDIESHVRCFASARHNINAVVNLKKRILGEK